MTEQDAPTEPTPDAPTIDPAPVTDEPTAVPVAEPAEEDDTSEATPDD